jgi:hypothetical protein
MHECFWIRGEKQGLGGERESGKMNWELATNARMFLDSGREARVRWRMRIWKNELKISCEWAIIRAFVAKLKA